MLLWREEEPEFGRCCPPGKVIIEHPFLLLINPEDVFDNEFDVQGRISGDRTRDDDGYYDIERADGPAGSDSISRFAHWRSTQHGH